MDTKCRAVLDAALELSEKDRAAVARELLATLSPVDDPLMDDQLAIELDRRLEESLSDPSATISWTVLKGER